MLKDNLMALVAKYDKPIETGVDQHKLDAAEKRSSQETSQRELPIAVRACTTGIKLSVLVQRV